LGTTQKIEINKNKNLIPLSNALNLPLPLDFDNLTTRIVHRSLGATSVALSGTLSDVAADLVADV
jgi:hypothetical protein